jgi:hypothetical protein
MFHQMKSAFLIALYVLCVVGAVLYPVTPDAHELGAQFDCKSNVHTFIAALEDGEYIDPKPIHVEKNSVNAFRPIHGSDLTAFGFHVYVILGYQREDKMFKKGAGEALPGSLYGAVVFGSADSVKVRLREAGSNAVVHEVMPLMLTAIICKGS